MRRWSLTGRLIGLLAIAFVGLAVLVYASARAIAEQALASAHDQLLSAAVTAILEETALDAGEPTVDLPYGAFAMLGAAREDRVFYRISALDADGGLRHVTGYAELPFPTPAPSVGEQRAATADYLGAAVRIVAGARAVSDGESEFRMIVAVAQTQDASRALSGQTAAAAAALALAMLGLAVAAAWLAIRSAFAPLRALETALRARGPRDLDPIAADAPRETAALVDALNQFLGRLSSTLDQMENFIAEGAHRIRTPLAGVRAQAEMAMRAAKQDRTRDAFRKIIRAVDQTGRAAGQILDHAMAAYRANRWRPQSVDLTELARAVVDDARPSADLKDIALAFDAPIDAVTTVGDPILLGEALRNLLDNAIKYSAAETQVSVRLETPPGSARLIVEDEGPGLPPAEHGRVRERFARGDNVGDVVGSGLGLSIVEEAALAHGGALELSDVRPHGLSAALSLPLRPAPFGLEARR